MWHSKIDTELSKLRLERERLGDVVRESQEKVARQKSALKQLSDLAPGWLRSEIDSRCRVIRQSFHDQISKLQARANELRFPSQFKLDNFNFSTKRLLIDHCAEHGIPSPFSADEHNWTTTGRDAFLKHQAHCREKLADVEAKRSAIKSQRDAELASIRQRGFVGGRRALSSTGRFLLVEEIPSGQQTILSQRMDVTFRPASGRRHPSFQP